jgi:hypothetical protein
MKYYRVVILLLLFCSCGDLSDDCLQVQQVKLCYYPDEVSADEAKSCATILAEEGFRADCKLVSKSVLLVDVPMKDPQGMEKLLKRLANTLSLKLDNPFTIRVVTALEGKSSLSVSSD